MTTRLGARILAAGRRARAGACVGGGSPIGGGEDHVQSGNFKLGSWLGPEGAGMDEGPVDSSRPGLTRPCAVLRSVS